VILGEPPIKTYLPQSDHLFYPSAALDRNQNNGTGENGENRGEKTFPRPGRAGTSLAGGVNHRMKSTGRSRPGGPTHPPGLFYVGPSSLNITVGTHTRCLTAPARVVPTLPGLFVASVSPCSKNFHSLQKFQPLVAQRAKNRSFIVLTKKSFAYRCLASRIFFRCSTSF